MGNDEFSDKDSPPYILLEAFLPAEAVRLGSGVMIRNESDAEYRWPLLCTNPVSIQYLLNYPACSTFRRLIPTSQHSYPPPTY